MRAWAAVLGIAALACLLVGIWLLAETAAFYWSDAYAPGVAPYAITVRGVEADGSAIFVPALLLLGLAAFLGKFALNLWRDP